MASHSRVYNCDRVCSADVYIDTPIHERANALREHVAGLTMFGHRAGALLMALLCSLSCVPEARAFVNVAISGFKSQRALLSLFP